MTAVKLSNLRSLKAIGRRSQRGRKEWGFLVIWQFQVRPGMQKRFRRVYGPRGDWVQLFVRDDAYVTTELVREPDTASYVTLDFWTSQSAYDAFRKQHRAEYRAIDLKCEGLTESEQEIGRFVRAAKQ
jgi:heme-degrading monooxygenase HmoA